MQRVVIFAGAGASKAVNSKEFPTTVEFFDRLPDSVLANSTFRFALEYIKRVEQPQQIDIEMVLWALETLQKDLKNLRTDSYITGNLFRSRLVKEILPTGNIGSFGEFLSRSDQRVSLLISEINEIVYDLYGYEPKKTELSRNWLPLLDRFVGSCESLEIFTTNYDAAIETALDIKLGNEKAKECRGVSGRVRQKLDLRRWVELGGRDITLTKLHGSVDWKRAGNEIHVGDSNFTGDHSKHAIIYPGFKGKSEAQFFSLFHSHFAKAVAQSSLIIAVGFAFRDEHINSIIRENCSASTRVVIINPGEVDFPSGRVTAKWIDSVFDRKAVDLI